MENTWLLTWNPKLTSGPWSQVARKVQSGKAIEERWSSGVTKSIQPGDRIFLIRLGVEPRAIVGSGYATTRPSKDSAWEGKPNRRAALYIKLKWDRLLDSDASDQKPLEIHRLPLKRIGKTNWSPQASGIMIAPELVAKLEAAWHKHYARVGHVAPAEVQLETWSGDRAQIISGLEGAKSHHMVIHRKREARLRIQKVREAIASGNFRCEVPGCGLDFRRIYGSLGTSCAEVHHQRALASRDRPSQTLLSELSIVCANCHRAIHSGNECRPLESLFSSLARLQKRPLLRLHSTRL